MSSTRSVVDMNINLYGATAIENLQEADTSLMETTSSLGDTYTTVLQNVCAYWDDVLSQETGSKQSSEYQSDSTEYQNEQSRVQGSINVFQQADQSISKSIQGLSSLGNNLAKFQLTIASLVASKLS